MKKWWELSYKSLRETVVYLQGKRKEKEEEMLFKMRYLPFPDAMRDIEQIFRQNKHLKLHRSKIFRAWYKHHKLWEKKDPEFYQKLLDAGMTPHELDPYFDPNAPDWEQFDTRPHYDDDDYDDNDNDDYNNNTPNLRKAAEEGFFMGIGFGAANSIINN